MKTTLRLGPLQVVDPAAVGDLCGEVCLFSVCVTGAFVALVSALVTLTESAAVFEAGFDAVFDAGETLVGLFLADSSARDSVVDACGCAFGEEIDNSAEVIAGKFGDRRALFLGGLEILDGKTKNVGEGLRLVRTRFVALGLHYGTQ